VPADIAMAGGARAVSDFRMLADQAEAFQKGRVGADGVPDAGGDHPGGAPLERKLTAAVSAATTTPAETLRLHSVD